HLGEIVLAKPMRFTEEEKNSHDPLSFNVRYGPFAVKTTDVPFFIVPIKPRYHRLLFPEAESQLELIPGSLAFGNSIRKAYLSNARVKSIPRGANLLFYRSEDSRSLTCLGVAEDSIVSSSAIEVAKYVGKRTLYSLKDIERFASRPILAVLFRLSRVFKTPIPFYELQQAGALSAPPQSIVRIPKEVEPWIADRLDT
ncbi:MAG: GNAT family N-acetyltransferase, partial [Chloroflexota bacterium]